MSSLDKTTLTAAFKAMIFTARSLGLDISLDAIVFEESLPDLDLTDLEDNLQVVYEHLKEVIENETTN